MALTVHARAVQALLKELEAFLAAEQNDEEMDGNTERRRQEELRSIMLALSTAVGSKLLDKALAISMRKGFVHEYRAECGRSMFRVKGDSNVEYKVLTIGYCSCRNFVSERVGTSLPLCKHLLAAHLSKAQGTAQVTTLADEEWAKAAWGVS